ncbi:hypothetical protein CHS0354_010475 [Potamilus streckersoni]|uniref:Uncharacterized protein n=1 Tax=Potamilus streckersoni TaxID=2493646 RepID=A0AAE0RRK6_9BIVA|nr:hypothetical protein CHS0354_010475 [Potamilus streckersoni]
MAQGGNRNGISWEDLKKARRLQELFHGRFSENDAVCLFLHCNRDLQNTINFVFEGEPADIRNVIGGGEWRVVASRNNRNIAELKRNEIQADIRQFGCERCDNMWWHRVPSRKLVSRCKVCHQKFDAILKENEWGWAKHICDNCGKTFNGFGAMNHTQSPCYDCGTLCMPVEIIPPFRRPSRRARNLHSCTASNCYNRAQVHDRVPIVSMCVHPFSMPRKVLNPSQPHTSTGSTVKTFLDQDDLMSFCHYEPSLTDINEESSNGNDDVSSD